MFWCFDSEPYAISANLKDGDFDVVGQYDFLVFLATDYKHSTFPLKKVPSTLRRDTECKKYTQFWFLMRFVDFNFLNFSGKLLTFSK